MASAPWVLGFRSFSVEASVANAAAIGSEMELEGVRGIVVGITRPDELGRGVVVLTGGKVMTNRLPGHFLNAQGEEI